MKSGSALQRLKAARRGSREQQLASHSAARSDAENEAYLQEMTAAFEQLTSPSTSRAGQLAVLEPPPSPGHSTRSMPTPAASSHRSSMGSGPSSRKLSPSRSAHTHAGPAVIGAGAHWATTAGQHITSTWRAGPTDTAGVLVQVSERPLLCSASMTDGSGDVVVGSSDHALYVVDTKAGRKKRTLYSKTTGHTEWVTCVCCLPGGRVLSGGMDGRLWLWPAAGTSGTELKAAHDAPVAKVATLAPQATADPDHTSAQVAGRTSLAHSRSNSMASSVGASGRGRPAAAAATGVAVLAVSCSYDKTVKVWEVSGRAGRQVAVMTGHAGPVLELAVDPAGDCVLTGDRKGGLMCWDVAAASGSWGIKTGHTGHITALCWQQQGAGPEGSSCVALSGGQDGYLKAWDSRTGSAVAQQALHVDGYGKGAIGGIVTVEAGSQQLVATMGADQTLKVVDPAAGYRARHTVHLSDFPYSLAAAGDGLVVCGCGDGSTHVVDVVEGKTLYALGAGQAAVRGLEVSPDRLVCSGDDGCVVAYSFQ